MQVKNLVPWAGHNFSLMPGDLVELDDEVAADRIKAGLAEAIAEATAEIKSLPADPVESIPGALHSIRHMGKGRYVVIDPAGTAIGAPVTKDEALAQAQELDAPAPVVAAEPAAAPAAEPAAAPAAEPAAV